MGGQLAKEVKGEGEEEGSLVELCMVVVRHIQPACLLSMSPKVCS